MSEAKVEIEVEPFVARMADEFDELNEKCKKLQIFVDGDFFKTLTKEEQTLLVAQLASMRAYGSVLLLRINYYVPILDRPAENGQD